MKLANLHIREKSKICRENSKYGPDENFVAIFAFAERLPATATLLYMYF